MSESTFPDVKLKDPVETLDKETAIYTIKVSDHLGPEYISLFNDIARFLIIQISIQTLLVTIDPGAYSLFSADFFILLMFIVIGVMAYWLVFRKIISFV